jgi:hypothetical protein
MTETTGTFIHRQQSLKQLEWEEIREPGAYVEVSTGNLYRVPHESLLKGAAPIAREPGGPASPLVLLSKDPFIFALAARMICVEHNIQPNF